MDLFPVDIRRFGSFHNNDAFLRERSCECLGVHYQIPYPKYELTTGRPLRCSPFYDRQFYIFERRIIHIQLVIYHRLKKMGACFGNKMGWERANFFATENVKPEMKYTFGKPHWLPAQQGMQ
jgi:hypothetical protein